MKASVLTDIRQCDVLEICTPKIIQDTDVLLRNELPRC